MALISVFRGSGGGEIVPLKNSNNDELVFLMTVTVMKLSLVDSVGDEAVLSSGCGTYSGLVQLDKWRRTEDNNPRKKLFILALTFGKKQWEKRDSFFREYAKNGNLNFYQNDRWFQKDVPHGVELITAMLDLVLPSNLHTLWTTHDSVLHFSFLAYKF